MTFRYEDPYAKAAREEARKQPKESLTLEQRIDLLEEEVRKLREELSSKTDPRNYPGYRPQGAY